jgi:hypothetical protein
LTNLFHTATLDLEKSNRAGLRQVSALKHLAVSLHLGRWKESYMAIGTAYFDASGHKEDPVVVVAGYLSPTVTWLRFEREWNRCIAHYGISGLHMKEFAHSIGEFSRWKGNGPLRGRFLGDCIRVITENVDNSFACAVHMGEYAEVDRLYCLREWAHPYAIAGAHCIGKTKSWANKFGHDISAFDHVFEAGDEGKGDLFKLASTYLSIDPIFKTKAWSVAFQAADLIAYEHYKANLKVQDMGEGNVNVEDLRIPFQKLAGIPGSAEWGVVLRETLLEQCQKYNVPLRK